MNCFTFRAKAQEITPMENDTIYLSAGDSTTVNRLWKMDSLKLTADSMTLLPFKPNPTRAVIYSAIFPGAGQIYNRKYWKLPLVYGGFMGFMYAVTWNNKNYQDYRQAYFDVMTDDPNGDPGSWHTSWQSFVPAGRDVASYLTDTNFQSRLKNGRDFYRRYRDLSIILTAAWYLICMADAYVDAQLFDFDISPDLSLHLEPVLTPGTSHTSRLYGISCSIKF
jgi:hypothetical protein